MVARPAIPFRSGNAGEFSEDVRGRLDIKQYYSAGLAYKNIEPVPQSGFRQMGGTWRMGLSRRPLAQSTITSPTLTPGPHTGTQTVWSGNAGGVVAVVQVNGFSIDAGAASFWVERQTAAGVWTPLTGTFIAAGSAVSRLAAFRPGQQQDGIPGSNLRVRATFTEAATVSIASVEAFFEAGTQVDPRFASITTDTGEELTLWFTAGIADIYDYTTEWKGAVRVPGLTAAMLPDLGFYSEGYTVGVLHPDLETVRLFLANPATAYDWQWGTWDYDPPPPVDLGGVYPQTDDVWEIFIRWTGTVELYLSFTVDGETTPAVPHTDGVGGTTPISSGSYSSGTWTAFAADIQTALRALPGMSSGVTVAQAEGVSGKSRKLTITFSGDLAGTEYQVSAVVTNTADASALPYHTQVGETELEALFSSGRGWPGFVELVQDRMVYYHIKAVTGSLALSRVAEYFDLDITSVADNAARLDRLRSQTNETILAVKESSYMLVYTERAAYFVSNRTIERNTPLNFVKADETGIAANCAPFDLEGIDYYVGRDADRPAWDPSGHQLLSMVYDDVSTKYTASPESLLASHLVSGIVRTARQRKSGSLDAAKGWLMRNDGRLVAAQLIKNQDITGFCEWVAAHGGLVREIGVDGRNRLWMSIEWDGLKTIQAYDAELYLHDTRYVTPDLAGVVSNLPPDMEGIELHAVADGYELPNGYTVQGRSIDLQDAYSSVIVGRWQPPRFESMPHVLITPGEDVLWRPGRIHTAHLHLVDTTSIAVGANGSEPQDITLNEIGDPEGQPMPGKTKMITVTGEDLPGFMTGTTLVVTQTRPGRLRVREYAVGAKL